MVYGTRLTCQLYVEKNTMVEFGLRPTNLNLNSTSDVEDEVEFCKWGCLVQPQ